MEHLLECRATAKVELLKIAMHGRMGAVRCDAVDQIGIVTMNEPLPTPPARWKRWLLEGALFLSIVLGVQLWQACDVLRGPATQFQGVLASGGEISAPSRRTLFRYRVALECFEWVSAAAN